MSVYKRIFIDKDPPYAAVRAVAARQAWTHIDQFKFRLAWNRKNRLASSPRWDPLWRSALSKAVKELGVDSVNVNEGAFFRTADDASTVKARAEVLWAEKLAERRTRLGQRA